MRSNKRALKKVCTQDRRQQKISDYSKLDVKPCLVVAFTFPILLTPTNWSKLFVFIWRKVRLKQTCQTRMGSSSTDVDVNGEQRDGLDSNLPLMFQMKSESLTYKIVLSILTVIEVV